MKKLTIITIAIAIALVIDFAYSPPLVASLEHCSLNLLLRFCVSASACRLQKEFFACGEGHFLLRCVEKLLPSCHCGSRNFSQSLRPSHTKSFNVSRSQYSRFTVVSASYAKSRSMCPALRPIASAVANKTLQSVESTPDEGTTFTIRLPIAKRQTEPQVGSVTKATGFELSDAQHRAEIIERNRKYLASKGWLESIEALPYKPLYILEDEKLPQFLERVAHEKNRQMGFMATLSGPLTEEMPPLPTAEDVKREMDKSILPIAHLLQTIYFYSQGNSKEAEKAYETGKALEENGGAETHFFSSGSPSDTFFGIAKGIYMYGGIDYIRARYIFNLGLKLFNWEEQNHVMPHEYAMNLAAMDLWKKKKQGISIIKSMLPISHRFASERLPALASQDTAFGKGLRTHFEETKRRTMEASSHVQNSGTAVVLGAGSFVVLPLKEMLRERLPDGRIKYEKILLVELAVGVSEKAVEQLVQSGEITSEEAGRVEVINSDATLILDLLTRKIDKLMEDELKPGDKKVETSTDSVIRLFEEISTPKGLSNYALSPAERFLADRNVNFVVFAMAIQDFASPIKDYLDMWAERLNWQSATRNAIGKWSDYSTGIQRNIVNIVLRDLARALKDEGVVFLADTTGVHTVVAESISSQMVQVRHNFEKLVKTWGQKEADEFLHKLQVRKEKAEQAKAVTKIDYYDSNGLSELVTVDLPFEIIGSATWQRPLNENEAAEKSSSHFVIQSLILKRSKTEKNQLQIMPESEQTHSQAKAGTTSTIRLPIIRNTTVDLPVGDAGLLKLDSSIGAVRLQQVLAQCA